MPLKFSSFQRTTSGNIVTSVSGAEIIVVGYAISAAAASLVRWSDEAGNFYSGQMNLGNTLFATYSGSKDSPAFVVAKNQSLAVTTSAATTIGGHVTYYTNE